MTIKIFFLTKMSDWNIDRNHIVIKYNDQEILSEQLAYISIPNRMKLCKLFKLSFWPSVKFCCNYYTRQPRYKHYKLLWESEDIAESIPFLLLIHKDNEENKDRDFYHKSKDSVLDIIANIL